MDRSEVEHGGSIGEFIRQRNQTSFVHQQVCSQMFESASVFNEC